MHSQSGKLLKSLNYEPDLAAHALRRGDKPAALLLMESGAALPAECRKATQD